MKINDILVNCRGYGERYIDKQVISNIYEWQEWAVKCGSSVFGRDLAKYCSDWSLEIPGRGSSNSA